jgi:hypothetical protein
MPLQDRLYSNPEIVDVQKLVGDLIEELLNKRYGEGNVTLVVRNSKIISMKCGVVQSTVFDEYRKLERESNKTKD